METSAVGPALSGLEAACVATLTWSLAADSWGLLRTSGAGRSHSLEFPDGLRVVAAQGDHHERAPGDSRLALLPDVPVELTWDDYAAGRDPVLEAALRD